MEKQQDLNYIQVCDNLRIKRLDKYSLQLEQLTTVKDKTTKKDKQIWKWVGYHSAVEDAIHQAVRIIVKDNLFADTITIQEVLKKLDSIYSLVKGVTDVNKIIKAREQLRFK